MNGILFVIVICVAVLGIIWYAYYTYATKEIELARADRVNKLTRTINYIDKLSQKVSLIPTTSSLYRILYTRHIALLEELSKEDPNSDYVNEKLTIIQERMDTVDNVDMLNQTGQKRNLIVPNSEEEASEIAKIIYSVLKFIAREGKFIDSKFVDVHKERERLKVMMIELKCEMLYNKSTKAAAAKKRGEEIFYLEKGLEIIIDNNIEDDVFSELKTKLTNALESAKLKKIELPKELEKKPDESGLDRVTSYDKSHWQ
jgi:hypothetical protein